MRHYDLKLFFPKGSVKFTVVQGMEIRKTNWQVLRALLSTLWTFKSVDCTSQLSNLTKVSSCSNCPCTLAYTYDLWVQGNWAVPQQHLTAFASKAAPALCHVLCLFGSPHRDSEYSTCTKLLPVDLHPSSRCLYYTVKALDSTPEDCFH